MNAVKTITLTHWVTQWVSNAIKKGKDSKPSAATTFQFQNRLVFHFSLWQVALMQLGLPI